MTTVGNDWAGESLKVGSIVRAPRTAADKPKGRAMVAMIQEDESVCLLWEPCILKPLQKQAKFVVAPSLSTQKASPSSSEEVILEKKRIQPLLDFELKDSSAIATDIKDQTTAIQQWKDLGDQLLRMGDPSTAILYYEMALHISSRISIGVSVICSIQGYPKVAEVDCVEDNIVDAVFVESGEETTIPKSDVLISILDANQDDHLQERILLNLARCLLQHADIDTPNRARYVKSAILACTLVLSISSYFEPEGGPTSDTAQSALQLRVKAQIGLSKWPHATADCKRLMQAENSQGRKLLEQVERGKKSQAKRDKKLSKAVSQLVQNAMTQSVSDDGIEGKEHVQKDGQISAQFGSSQTPSQNQSSMPFSSPHFILLVVVAAFLIQKLLSSSSSLVE